MSLTGCNLRQNQTHWCPAIYLNQPEKFAQVLLPETKLYLPMIKHFVSVIKRNHSITGRNLKHNQTHWWSAIYPTTEILKQVLISKDHFIPNVWAPSNSKDKPLKRQKPCAESDFLVCGHLPTSQIFIPKMCRIWFIYLGWNSSLCMSLGVDLLCLNSFPANMDL